MTKAKALKKPPQNKTTAEVVQAIHDRIYRTCNAPENNIDLGGLAQLTIALTGLLTLREMSNDN